MCCAEESKFSISAKIAKCRPENKCILHGQFALICLFDFFLCFCFAWIWFKCPMLEIQLKHFVLKLRQSYLLTQSLLLSVSPCSQRCCFHVLRHAMQNTPCAVTVGIEHRRGSSPGQGKQLSLSLETLGSSTALVSRQKMQSWLWAGGTGISGCMNVLPLLVTKL